MNWSLGWAISNLAKSPQNLKDRGLEMCIRVESLGLIPSTQNKKDPLISHSAQALFCVLGTYKQHRNT